MINFIFIIFCVSIGYVIRRTGLIQNGAHKGINAWILYIALPACFLRYIPEVSWTKATLLPCLSPLIVWAGAWVTCMLYCKKYNVDQKSRAAMKLTAGLSNTAFLGFISVFYSDADIPIAVLFDQSSFILLSSVGLLTAVRESGTSGTSPISLIKQLGKFPPLWACLLALLLSGLSFDYSFIFPFLNKMTVTIGPLALFSVGIQLDFKTNIKQVKKAAVAISYKLLLAPLLVLLFAILIDMKGHIAQISVFEASMPTLATAVVLADEYDLNPPLASLITGLSVIVSFFTTGLWWWVLEQLH